MLACTLNANAEKGASTSLWALCTSYRGAGDGAKSTTASSRSRTPKLVSADPKNTGVTSPARNPLRSISVPSASSSSNSSLASCQPLVDGSTWSIGDLCSSDSVAPWAVRSYLMKVFESRSTIPFRSPGTPTGHDIGVGSSCNIFSISSMSSSGGRPGRSHLLTKVRMGTSRCRQTSNSFKV